MLDALWRQAHRALVHHLPEGGRVLLPAGDWPPLPFDTFFYRGSDHSLDIAGFECVLVHKGMLTSFRQSDIRLCLSELAVAFANPVFVLFVPRPGRLALVNPLHMRRLRVFADPARYRRADPRACAFIHVPKAAGTSVWCRVSPKVPSSIYFSSNAALAGFEGDLNAFEAVGGHIHAETLRAKGWQGRILFCLRDPVARVVSFVAHARRERENLAMLDGSFHEARDMTGSTLDATQRNLLWHEGAMQTRVLGERAGENLGAEGAPEIMLRRALSRLDDPRYHFGLVEQPAHLARAVARQFGLRVRGLPHLNRSEHGDLPGNADAIRRFLLSDGACLDLALYRHAVERLSRG